MPRLSLTYVQRCLVACMAVFQGVTAANRIDAPLMFDAFGRYAVGVTMSSTSSLQNFNFTISTSTGLTYVAGTGSNGIKPYNATASSTAQSLYNTTGVSIFGDSTNATVIKETCALVASGGMSWEYDNQTIIVIDTPHQSVLQTSLSAVLGSNVSGIVGLGTNRGGFPSTAGGTTADTYQPTFQDSLVGQFLLRQPEATNFTFGLALEKPVIHAQPHGTSPSTLPLSPAAGLPAGVLSLLGVDSALYSVNNVSWVTANISETTNSTSASGNSSIPQGDWSIIMNGWELDSRNNTMQSKGKILANIDPIYTGIYLPQDQVTLIHDAIPGSAQSNLSTLGKMSQAWTLPCNSNFTFRLLIGSQIFALDESILVIDQGLDDNTCVSGLEGWTDSFETMYLFGARFLSTVYLIFNVPNNGSQTIGFSPRSSPMDSSLGNTSSSSSSHVEIGTIIGSVLGGFGLVVISLCVFYYIIWRPRRDRSWESPYRANTPISESKLPGYIEPFTLLAPSSVQAYNERSPQDNRGRPPSPLSIIFSSPEADDPHPRLLSTAPPSYRYDQPFPAESPLPDRIYQVVGGNVSLISASASISGSIPHTPVSVSAPTFATMATCG